MESITIYNHKIFDEGPRQIFETPCFKVCLVTKGEGDWQISGTVYRVKKGDIILLGAGDRRIFKKIKSGELSLTAINFEPGIIFGTPFLPLYVNRAEDFPRVTQSTEEARRLFGEFARESAQKNTDYKTALISIISLLLINIKRQYTAIGYSFRTTKLSPEMYMALSYIDENFDKEISLHSAAGIIPMSQSAFSRYFKKCTGVGFARYVNQKRIGKAIYLLQNTNETVLSIALNCGFNNTVSFYKAFSAQTNIKPAEYRKQEAVL